MPKKGPTEHLREVSWTGSMNHLCEIYIGEPICNHLYEKKDRKRRDKRLCVTESSSQTLEINTTPEINATIENISESRRKWKHTLTHTHTHSHTHTHTHTQSHTRNHTHSHTLSLSHTHTHTHRGIKKLNHSVPVCHNNNVKAVPMGTLYSQGLRGCK